jgi:pyridoxamine 5'-phosphate oxidase
MTLATADGAGRVSSRVLICKDVDETGRWYFASSSDSEKGRDLAANPHAAASFYWPQQGRQIRIRGRAGSAGRRASAEDFLARPPASRAAALIGQQSKPMSELADLDDAFRACEAKIEADPGARLDPVRAVGRDGRVLAGRPPAPAPAAAVRAGRRLLGQAAALALS